MRAVLLTRTGGPDVLRVVDAPAPTPGPGEVSIRVRTIGLNYAEVLSRKGLYGWAPKRPYVLGMEGFGHVEAVGPEVDESRIGEAVIVGTQHGAYAEVLLVPEALALPAFDDWSPEENAAFGVNWLTAWVSLVGMGRMLSTDRVLVSPAGGGVGTAAVQIASRFGCEVVAMAGSDAKLDKVRELGASHTVNYRAPGWRQTLSEAVRPGGVDVALEMVGSDVFRAVRDELAPMGRVVVAGYASLDYRVWNPLSWWRAWRGMPRMSLDHMLRRSSGMLSTHLGFLLRDPQVMRRTWEDLVSFVAEHELTPVVGHVLPFEDVAEAHRLIESRNSYGKVVLRV